MKPIYLLIAILLQFAMAQAQSPDWTVVPNNLATPANTVTPLPGTYSTTPYYAANCAYDNSGNIAFYVVDGSIYNAAGTFTGSLTPSLGYNGKKIIIVPDPGNCNARLIFHTGGDIIVGGSTSCYHVTYVRCTRVVISGSSLTIVHNYSSSAFVNSVSQCNLYVSMAVSKPLSSGNRYLYVAGDKSIFKYVISPTGISLPLSYTTGYDSRPTDLEVSPSGDKAAWSDANTNNGIRYMNLDASGDFVSFFQFPVSLGADQSSGLEFFNNTQVLVSAGIGSAGGIYKADLSTSVSNQVIVDSLFAKSQLEMSLDGKIYAASATKLMGIDPVSIATVFVTMPVISKAAYLTINYYSLPSQLDGETYSQTFSCTPPCPINVTITGTYTTPLTESQTWIKSNAVTIIPATAIVKLDADPVNGYVELNPGFETQPGALFIAQALDGCGSGIPSRQSHSITRAAQSLLGNGHQDLAKLDDAIKVYPNPTKGRITVQHQSPIKLLQVYNANGLLLQTIREVKTTSAEIDLGAYPSGIYLLRADGKMAGKVMKQ